MTSPLVRLAITALLLLIPAACGDDAGEGVPIPDASTPETESGPVGSDDTDPGPDPTEPATATDLRTTLAARGVAELALDPAEEGGSHPTLSWQPVEGASSYWLALVDGTGAPYWAWTGPDTSVRVGGGDIADENQTAALHETMTWSVAAFDADGNLLALSPRASISP